MTKISPHFSLEEMIVSETAVRHGINNEPTQAIISRLRDLCLNSLEKVRGLTDQPVIVTSGYRSVVLNSIIGGAPGSQHTKGEAADIHCKDTDQQDLFNLIQRSDIPFDQLIDEFQNWVHISFTAHGENRREMLRARHVHGVTQYTRVE